MGFPAPRTGVDPGTSSEGWVPLKGCGVVPGGQRWVGAGGGEPLKFPAVLARCVTASRNPVTVLLLVLALTSLGAPAMAQAEAAFPELELQRGAWWRYAPTDASGTVRDGDRTHVRVLDLAEMDGREVWEVETRQRVNRTVDNGTITETTVSRVLLTVGDLRVLQREVVHVRDGSFRDVPVYSYERNVTSYDPTLPLVPLRAEVGDMWRDEVEAVSRVNRTTLVGEGEDQRRVREGPRTHEATEVQVLEVEGWRNGSTPAGSFDAVVVNRSVEGRPGWVVERWSGEAGYMVGWMNRNATGGFAGGAVLEAHGVDRAAEEGLDWVPWVVAGAAIAALAGAVAWWLKRRGDGEPPSGV